MQSKDVIAALAALAHESRLAVFRLLVQAGPDGMAATRIADELGIPPSSLSFHLKELTLAGLATQTKAGRSLIYAANFATMNGLVGFLTENCCGGEVCTPASVTSVPSCFTPAIKKGACS
jgi:ArsR family transcriptional regulator, arsenate/arsenite/antimonite-responsive transcriptional repressor